MVISELALRGHPVESVDICYVDGLRVRQERHFLFQRGPVSIQWQQQKAEFGGTFESILKWSQAYKAHGQISLSIWEGNHRYSSRRDDYARDNGLIRVDAPRGTYFLNPERDYICQRRINTRGQVDEMTEFAKTATGRWYPRRIEDSTKIQTIYLDTNAEIPEGIFDPNTLPKGE